MADPHEQLTSTTREALRTKLDDIIRRMIENGEPETNIRTMVDDFKGRYLLAAPPSAPEPSWLDLAATGAGQTLKSLVAAPVHLARTVGEAVTSPESRRYGVPGIGANLLNRLVVDPAIEQGQKSAAAFGEGRVSEGVGHGFAALLPGIGPAAANIGEKIGTGDPLTMAEGVGDAGAMALAGPVTRALGPAAAAFGRGAQNVGRATWLRAAQVPEGLAKQTAAYRRTGELAAGDTQIADTILSRRAGALTRDNASGLTQDLRAAGRDVQRAYEPPYGAELPAADLLAVIDREIAGMRASGRPAAEIAEAVAQRQAVVDRWTVERTTPPTTQPVGDVAIDPATAGRVRSGQVQDYVDMVNRPTMRHAEAPHRTPTGPPGETFEAVYPHRAPAAQTALNEAHAVPDVVRMGGRAGEYQPIATTTTTTAAPGALSARAVQALRRARGSDPVSRALRDVAGRWMENTPASAAAAAYGELRPAAAALQKAARRTTPLSINPIALAQRPGLLSRAGQAAYTTGGRMQSAAPLASSAARGAFPAQLIGQVADDDPEQAELTRRLIIQQLMASH